MTDAERAIAERDGFAQELFETERFAASLVVERHRLADALAAAEARAENAARPIVEAARAERDQAFAERDQALAERDRALAAEAASAAMLRRVVQSTSWRATAPLRRVLIALRGHERGL